MKTCGGCGLAGLDADERNVQDIYRYWHTECIADALKSEKNDLIIIVENISGDFNLSSVIRSANQFSCKETWIVGRRKWDKRGAVGVNHYETIKYAPDIAECVTTLRSQGYSIVAADNVEGAIPLTHHFWEPKTAIIFGEEQRGLTQESLDIADAKIFIPTRGSARSLNVASAASIFMWDYCSYSGTLDKF